MLSLRSDHDDIEVRLPDALSRFGRTTMLRVAGKRTGPVIVVLGGISGNRFICSASGGGPGWWPGLVGEGCAIDPAVYCILGLDFAADRTGRCAPSTADQALVLETALRAAAITAADAIVGASYGGMVALSFAEKYPSKVKRLCVISAAAAPHPAACAARELQRRVVAMGLQCGAAEEALSIARGMAMMTYRTQEEFAQRFAGGLAGEDPLAISAPGAYLNSRGEAFKAVMSPERFLSLSASIDRHCVTPEHIATPTLLIGTNSDQVVPPSQMRDLADRLAGPSELHLLDCIYGHDTFLKEAVSMGQIIKPFLDARH